MEAREASLAIRAAWLYYVHALTQAEVADRLGISRVKVHRLVARAHEENWVKVFVEGSTAEGIALEQALKEQFNLDYCTVAPSDIDGWAAGHDGLFRSLGSAAALYLHQYLEHHPKGSIGVGHGRTLAAPYCRPRMSTSSTSRAGAWSARTVSSNASIANSRMTSS